MPLRWEILHPEKLIHVIAEGPVTLQQLEEHFDAVITADALSYAKLFDATGVKAVFSDHDVMMLGARLSFYTSNFESGPLAVVVNSEEARMAFRRFVNISPSKRPAKLFSKEAEARAWLATKPARNPL